jgi:hypothetical protein
MEADAHPATQDTRRNVSQSVSVLTTTTSTGRLRPSSDATLNAVGCADLDTRATTPGQPTTCSLLTPTRLSSQRIAVATAEEETDLPTCHEARHHSVQHTPTQD